MGTKLTNQKRGHGGPSYRVPGHRFFGHVTYAGFKGALMGQVTGFVDDPAHSALLMEVLLENGRKAYSIAPEGIAKGDVVGLGGDARVRVGSVMPVSKIPDGTPIFNIELSPGDGGKMSRSSGTACYIVSHDEESGRVIIRTPSKNVKVLEPGCLATVGVACGGGRLEKPFKKAGSKFHAMHARNKYYPKVRGTAMSAYDHPHGGKSLGKPSTVARGTPPGRKVGHIAARRTGRRRGKIVEEEEVKTNG